MWENSVFSRFSRQFVQSSQRMRKKSVFWAFCATFLKKCKKTVFFDVFRDTLYKVRKTCEKTTFFVLFARRLSKCVRKQCFFFTFFETLCMYKVLKKCEKTAFFELFALSFAKSMRKQRFFTFFKKGEKQCFLTFFETLCTKFAKNAINSVFRAFCAPKVWEIRKKCGETAFFELFARRSSKSVRKHCFLTFFETLCTKFA